MTRCLFVCTAAALLLACGYSEDQMASKLHDVEQAKAQLAEARQEGARLDAQLAQGEGSRRRTP